VSRLLRREVSPKACYSKAVRVEDAAFPLHFAVKWADIFDSHEAFLEPHGICFFNLLVFIERINNVFAEIEAF
jgi:hypothetical protein